MPVPTNLLSFIETPRWGEAKVISKFILSLNYDKCFKHSLATTPPSEYPINDILR